MKNKNLLSNSAKNILNSFMRVILRSPLHRIASKSVMLLKFNGRKTGRVIETPISYIREGQIVTAFTSAPWRKNLAGGALVRMWIANHEYTGWAMPCEGSPEAVTNGLMRFLTLVPENARFYKVSIGPDGIPNSEQVALAARHETMIQIKLSTRGMK